MLFFSSQLLLCLVAALLPVNDRLLLHFFKLSFVTLSAFKCFEVYRCVCLAELFCYLMMTMVVAVDDALSCWG